MPMIDLSGARILRTAIADPAPVPLTRPRRPKRWPGVLVVRFGVAGHVAQWVTHGTSGTKATQREYLRIWQAAVAGAATVAMRNARATLAVGMVEVWIDAVFAPGTKLPDRDNIVKGTTDALQGIIFLNDVQVVGGEGRRLLGPVEGAVIEVWSVKQPTIGG